MRNGMLFVISGPSGTGKGTICRMLLDEVDAALSVSMTTRKPRQGETDGKSYHFISVDNFEQMVVAGGFLEYASVYGNYYGTPKQEVLDKLEKGIDVILEIDVQGAAQIKEKYPTGIFIFILPPSLTELRERIRKRGTEAEEEIKLRLSETLNELSSISGYDYYVINSNLPAAVASVKAIMSAKHSKVTKDIDLLIKKYKEEFNALSIDK